MTDLCFNLAPYLAGDLSDADAERFEHHALTCADCDAALALPADVADALASLADASCPPDVLSAAQSATVDEWPPAWSEELRALSATPCPPDVLAAALQHTRRAADRSPISPRHRRRRMAVWALAALLAIGVSWVALQGSDAPAQMAQVEPVPRSSTEPIPSTEPEIEAPLPDAGTSDRLDPAPLVAEATPPKANRETSGSPPPVSETPPDLPSQRTTEAPAPSGLDAAATPPPADLAEREPTAQEIEDAQRDLALAFGLVADAQSAARTQVREQTQTLASTLDRTSIF